MICCRLHKGLDYFGDYFCVITIVTHSISKGGWVFEGGEYPDEKAVFNFVVMSEKDCKKSDFLGQYMNIYYLKICCEEEEAQNLTLMNNLYCF